MEDMPLLAAGLLPLRPFSSSAQPDTDVNPPPAKRHCVAGYGGEAVPDGDDPDPFFPRQESGVDFSVWTGALTPSRAAQSKTVSELLKKSREFRGLLLDDRSDLVVHSARTQPQIHLTRAQPPSRQRRVRTRGGGRSAATSSIPHLSPRPTVAQQPVPSPSPPPKQRSAVWKNIYTAEVPLMDQRRVCMLDGGVYELSVSLQENHACDVTDGVRGNDVIGRPARSASLHVRVAWPEGVPEFVLSSNSPTKRLLPLSKSCKNC